MEEIITTEWSAWKECHSWPRSTECILGLTEDIP